MQSLKHAVAQLVSRGRIGRKKSFVVAVAVALFVMPMVTALAYFGATGGGTISNVAAGTSSATASVTQNGTLAYAGPSTTALVPGGNVTIPSILSCTANPPCVISSVTLGSWSSNKTGCDTTTMPGSFTLTSQSATFPVTISTIGTGSATPDNIVITWNNLATIDQTACAGGTFAFNLTIP